MTVPGKMVQISSLMLWKAIFKQLDFFLSVKGAEAYSFKD